jgi:hypothetical protein
MKLNVTKIGTSEVQLYDDASMAEVEKRIDARIRRTGESRHDGNIRQWYTDHEVLDDAGKNVWAKCGMKAKHIRYRVTLDKCSGDRRQERVGIIYKNLD